jgi:adenylate cyclase
MEQSHSIERKLAAILSADVHGYSRMMADDEVATVRMLTASREIIGEHVAQHRGRVVDSPGDNLLAEFPSAIDAVQCAIEVQRALAIRNIDLSPKRWMEFRIGIHLGDVMVEGQRIYGDGVNIAARLEGLAQPGGICISATVHEQVRGKLEVDYDDIGEQQVKNIPRPVRALRIRMKPVAPEGSSAPRSRRRMALVAVAGVAVLAAIMAVVLYLHRAAVPRVASSTATPAARLVRIRSIAVLPLENLSGDPAQEYFADGMTDELITDLARISALRVISRTSVMQYKGEHKKPLPEIARALNVDAVVEGSALQIGDKVRITAQLIDAPSDRHIWARSYERDARDVLAIQDEVASAIAREIDIQLTPDEQARFANARTVNPRAYEAYLKGRYHGNEWTEGGWEKAADSFRQAIKIDPKYARAYAGLSNCYAELAGFSLPPREAIPRAREFAQKALELDDTLGEAHLALALVDYSYDFDWAGGEKEFQRAIALNSNYAAAHFEYGLFLTVQGRFDEAQPELGRALQLNPLSPVYAQQRAIVFFIRRQYEKGMEWCRKASDLDPNSWSVHFCLGGGYLWMRKPTEAVPEFQRAVSLAPVPVVMGNLGLAYALAGDRDQAHKLIDELDQLSTRRFVSQYDSALIYAGLGLNDQALQRLEKAYEERSWGVVWIKVNAVFDPLRSDPRFIALLKKMHLDK